MVIYNFTGGFNMNILVCDDDREIVDAIEAYLKSEGYNILKSYSGKQDFHILRSLMISIWDFVNH
jgi:DNA-binding response OmpR family regulator